MVGDGTFVYCIHSNLCSSKKFSQLIPIDAHPRVDASSLWYGILSVVNEEFRKNLKVYRYYRGVDEDWSLW